MKRVMFIIVFGILFGFGQNMFGYTWKVYNSTNETIGVHFCTTWGDQNCQDANIPPNFSQKFDFSASNIGLMFGSAIVNGQSFDRGDFNNQTDWIRGAGGNVKVIKNADGSYGFKAIS